MKLDPCQMVRTRFKFIFSLDLLYNLLDNLYFVKFISNSCATRPRTLATTDPILSCWWVYSVRIRRTCRPCWNSSTTGNWLDSANISKYLRMSGGPLTGRSTCVITSTAQQQQPSCVVVRHRRISQTPEAVETEIGGMCRRRGRRKELCGTPI